MDKQYNGWSNYETWCVNLWLENEEPSYRYWRDQARLYAAYAPDSSLVWNEDYSIRDAARRMLADQLKAKVTDQSPLGKPAVFSDLLQAALDEVDWDEIAQHWLADYFPPLRINYPPEVIMFPGAQICCTAGALLSLTVEEIRTAISRHARHDWGLVSPDEKQVNDEALDGGRGICSVFESAGGERFMVTTNPERSLTTVLMPDEY